MKPRVLAFSARGMLLAQRFADELGGKAYRCGEEASLDEWSAEGFSYGEPMIFIGAVGIAVRAIAPYVQHKTTDPAVVVVDEQGKFSISLLSGHLGGANDLAIHVAKICNAIPVITTATDINGIFAVDDWARHYDCVVEFPEHIKSVSSKLLAGEYVTFQSDFPISGEMPTHLIPVETEIADFVVSIRKRTKNSLLIIPQILILGVGCKKGTKYIALEKFFREFMDQIGFNEKAVQKVCSIDLKKDEPGLLKFCRERHLPFVTFSAKELSLLEGDFVSSSFVENITGVDNVCERAAVCGGGILIHRKTAKNGITMALSQIRFAPAWRWQDE